GLANWTVYLDQNRNRVQDAGEATTTTDGTGHYTFTGLAAGTYYVNDAQPVAWKPTYPSASGASGALVAGSMVVKGAGIRPISTTGSTKKIVMDSLALPQNIAPGVTPTDVESGGLIHLPQYLNDKRLAWADGSGSSIVIIDTGIDLSNPEFGPDLNNDGIAGRIVYQHDFADNDNNAQDRNGHGTNVASIAAGSTYGMAPGANIIA